MAVLPEMAGRKGEEPPQNMKEYDPEWALAFWIDTLAASCDHARMLSSVKCLVLYTHHIRTVDNEGRLPALRRMSRQNECGR